MSDGNLGSAGLISSLILVGLIREQTFTVDISVSDLGSPISIHILLSQFMAPKRGVFNLPVFQVADQIGRQAIGNSPRVSEM